ncbi:MULTISPECIES: ribonuclease D [Vibrio]|uniref:Ribonuclease D n=2 Tax=Vibrio campbellii TaxID=680 RepID=A0AAE9SN69_9VIBR|nr:MULTISPECIES: ribonuclease D [Vibrio]ARR45146.1 ribonuclease D [Vibrio campbellii]MCE7730079.1 ribonuclease D [Vibrio campbellii]OQQ01389.1 ribonuclease D [Vibrio campbellii]UTZ25900.1 ribonuclease D [Vibrio campbellii]UTZ40663.1 ribonuclease D [Vibrio campbellii]
MNYQIITKNKDLEEVCALAREADVVMLDTEFVRIRTYYPQLGLIQLFDGKQLSLIDPTELTDMTSFVELLKDTSVLKVLHACGEDLEVFQNAFGCTPFPMVDTQLMAAFLGHGLSTGFATLVEEYLGVELDKSESRTDWMARPLTQKQLDYAAADVHYLMPLYEKLLDKVNEAGWWEAVQQESDLLVSKRIRNVNEENAYLDIKGAWQLRPAELAILKPLATWRYREAIKRDLALNFIFKEGDLLTVARLGLTGFKKMEAEGIDIRAINRHGAKIAGIVKQAKQTPADDYPAKIERLMDYPGYKQIFKNMKDVVKVASQKSGLATEFLASKKQINQIISWVWKKDRDPARLPDVMQGWRLELLGEKMNKVLK